MADVTGGMNAIEAISTVTIANPMTSGRRIRSSRASAANTTAMIPT